MADFFKYALWATAGHIDHGKTTLLKALTGIDADRLPEEKARGITIDIGFAHLATGEAELSFVDVPGHEAYVKNMLAGAGGADALLLVISANESIKPQTAEHFQIASLLGISTGVVVITKKDLADEDTLCAAKNKIAEFTKNTFLENAPVFCVDAVSGDGIAELKSALIDISKRIPQKKDGEIFRLPADRSFTIKGFGTIVTGTAMNGSVGEDDALILLPQKRNVRVKGIEVHGKKTSRSKAGWRTALNLQGVEAKEIARGNVLVNSADIRPTRYVDAIATLVPEISQIKQNSSLHFHHATSDVLSRVHIFEYESFQTSKLFFARIALDKETVIFAGDRFILRQFSHPFTVGGGVVLDNFPPRKKSSSDIKIFKEIFTDISDSVLSLNLPSPNIENLLRFFLRRSKLGLLFTEITARLGITRNELLKLLTATKDIVVIREGKGYVMEEKKYAQFSASLKETLEYYHRTYPLRPGAEWQALKEILPITAPEEIFNAMLQLEINKGKIAREQEYVRLADFSPKPAEKNRDIVRIIEERFLKAKLQPPSPTVILDKFGAQGREAFRYLLRTEKILKIESEYVVHCDIFGEFLSALKELSSSKKGHFDVSDVKTLTGLSRKYVIPLLEYLDRSGITIREGNFRRFK